jgi:glycine/D-amino acid oxidase-like deaminating enzyme
MSRTERIVICGGGAIGCAIAYFLTRNGARPIVIERHAIAGSASGKSGGFLAYDWCRGTPVDELARRSFDLHAELAEALGNPWFHRRLESYGGHAAANGSGKGSGPRSWLSPKVTLIERLGTPQTTAVLEPRAFTTGLMRAAEAAGAELRMGSVCELARSKDGAVCGVVLESGETIAADVVVIALGPWSLLAAHWLPMPAVYGYKGHSLIFETGPNTPDQALFLEYREPGGELLTPELFPRADGTTWVCAISSAQAVPIDPAHVEPDAGAHERLEALCRAISPVLAAAPIKVRQACFRPVTEDSLPLIGAVPGVDGAYVATGHSVWGMLNAPATGEAMAQLILDGRARHVDLAPFALSRLRPVERSRQRRSR